MRIGNLLIGAGSASEPDVGVASSLIASDVEVAPFESGVDVDLRRQAAPTTLAIGMTAAALRAERCGCDAAFINSTSDYGLEKIRAIVDMPGVGSGEAGAVVAASIGQRFAIVQVWPEWSRWLSARAVISAGAGDPCCSIRNVSHDGEEREVEAAMLHGDSARRNALLARVVETMSTAVREDQADVILLGCTCMSSAAPWLRAQVDVPVVDPLTAGYLAAEQAARLGLRSRDGTASGSYRVQLEPIFKSIAAALQAEPPGRWQRARQLSGVLDVGSPAR